MRHPYLIFVIVLAGTVAAGIALTAQDRVDLAMVARIRAEAAQRSKVLETFNYLTNVTGARPTGSRAHKQAADYVRGKLAEWGMANPRLEPFQFGRGWELQKFSLELTAPRYFPMFGYPLAWTPSTKGVLTGTPVYLADKTEGEITALGEKLRGAIILASPPQTVFQLTDRLQPADTTELVRIGGPEPPKEQQATSVVPVNAMATLLQKFGAGAILRPGTELHGTITVGGSPSTPDGAVPTVMVMAEHYNMIVRMMQAGVTPQLRLELRTAYQDSDLNSYNVIAEIPGEDPVLRNEVVIVGAHLDSLPAGAGATDNADGVVSVIEAMRILKAIGVHPRRTIRVAIWSGEEVGFVGGPGLHSSTWRLPRSGEWPSISTTIREAARRMASTWPTTRMLAGSSTPGSSRSRISGSSGMSWTATSPRKTACSTARASRRSRRSWTTPTTTLARVTPTSTSTNR